MASPPATSAPSSSQANISMRWRVRALNAFIYETPDIALHAQAADAPPRQEVSLGSLDGIPVAKDLFCTAGVLTTAGSHILEGFTPSYDSTVTASCGRRRGDAGQDESRRVRDGSPNTTSYFGPVKNPRGPMMAGNWCRAAHPAVRRRRSRRTLPGSHRHRHGWINRSRRRSAASSA